MEKQVCSYLENQVAEKKSVRIVGLFLYKCIKSIFRSN